MKKNALLKFGKGIMRLSVKHAPGILTGLGISGMFGAAIGAVMATPQALRNIEAEKERLDVAKLTPKETVKVTYKCYLPSVITGVSSAVCIVCGHRLHARRNAAIATAFSLQEIAMSEYKNKVREVVGEKKEQEIRDEINKDRMDKVPYRSSEVFITPLGETLFLDVMSKRYFKSDINRVRAIINDINRRLLSEMYISLNELYYELGLASTKQGELLGWHVDDGLIELDISAHLSEDDTPCLVLDYKVGPRYRDY